MKITIELPNQIVEDIKELYPDTKKHHIEIIIELYFEQLGYDGVFSFPIWLEDQYTLLETSGLENLIK